MIDDKNPNPLREDSVATDSMTPSNDEEMSEHTSETVEMTASASDIGMAIPQLFSKSGLPLNPLRNDLLNYLALSSKAHFKSQQMSDPELPYESKRLIAEELLDRSPAQFLERYGQFMQEHHLQYFFGDSELLKQESYEIEFHLKQLKRFHCKATHDVDVKNRRYDAMKKMIADGSSYFSEDEMRQRNPYLYEQLVGQYLSEEERRDREHIDTENITFVNLLLTKISRDATIELKKKQEREENGTVDISSNEDTDNESDSELEENKRERGTWGETPEKKTRMIHMRKKEKAKKKLKPVEDVPLASVEISEEERMLLMQEFVSTMYNSFIDGNDEEFDYSQVDSNPDFDCIDVRERDEEEKYFDEDSAEDNVMEVADNLDDSSMPLSLKEKKKLEEDEEDALDAFMKTVVPSAPTSDLTNSFQNLCRQGSAQPVELSRAVKKHVIKINIKKD